MLFDVNKSFGYPVLRPLLASDLVDEMDYPKVQFQASIGLQIDPSSPDILLINYDIKCPVQEIVDAIGDNTAAIHLGVECKRTFYNVAHRISWRGKLKVKAYLFRDQVEFTVFVVANQELNFHSKKMHKDYGEDPLKIPKNGLLAWSFPVAYNIEKDNLRGVKSIVEYIPSADVPHGLYRIDPSEDLIKIVVHDAFYEECLRMDKSTETKLIWLNSLIVPVLLDVIGKMIKTPDEYRSLRWFEVISQTCSRLKITLDDSLDIHEAVQKILVLPLDRMVKERMERLSS